ncbi:20 kDa antigen, putative, partial [Entamoeba nuttalli P19]
MRARMVGPGSSSSNYKATVDPCRFMGCGPSSSTTSGYRRPGSDAAGPMASRGTWAATTDIGVTAAAAKTSES